MRPPAAPIRLHRPRQRLAGSICHLHADERGAGLVESLVSTAILGLALVVLMGSFSTLAIASADARQVALAGSVARAQAARIKQAPYRADGDYSASLETLPAGLTRTVGTSWWNGISGWTGTQNANGLQLISLNMGYDGSTVASLELVEANR